MVTHHSISKMEILNKIVSLLDTDFIEKEKITRDTSIKELGINSLTYIKFVISIENEFSIEFEDDYLDWHILKSFGDLINYVEKNIQ